MGTEKENTVKNLDRLIFRDTHHLHEIGWDINKRLSKFAGPINTEILRYTFPEVRQRVLDMLVVQPHIHQILRALERDMRNNHGITERYNRTIERQE